MTQNRVVSTLGDVFAGKNRIINGGMDIWQRATTFGPSSATGYFTADRWFTTPTLSTYTLSQETSIVPTGFQYALKATANSTTAIWFIQFIESQNCQDLAGKTVTLSAYCATSDSSTLDFIVYYNTTFNANKDTAGWTALSTQIVSTTSTMPLTPQSKQFAIPSNAKALAVYIRNTASISTGTTFTLTGVQLELGSTATKFSRAGGTIQGELAACQRYYFRQNYDGLSNYAVIGFGYANTANNLYIHTPFPVHMRAKPSAIDTAPMNTFAIEYSNVAAITSLTSISLDSNYSSSDNGVLAVTKSAAFTVNQQYRLNGSNNSGAYIGWSAEL